MIFLNLVFFISSLLLFIFKCSTFRQCSTKDQLCYATFVFTFLPYGSRVFRFGLDFDRNGGGQIFYYYFYRLQRLAHPPPCSNADTSPRFLHPKRNSPLHRQICNRVPKKRHNCFLRPKIQTTSRSFVSKIERQCNDPQPNCCQV